VKPGNDEEKERGMGGEERVLKGIVRNGVIIPEPGVTLPEGTEVTITAQPSGTESAAEVARLSEEAVREVDQWERQE
jgi:hypothetical protein